MNGNCHKAGKYYANRRMALFAVCLSIGFQSHAQRYPFHNLNVDDGLAQSQATCLAQDKMGNLWIGTLGGLSRYDGRNFTNYTEQNGLRSNAVWALAVDTLNNIWIGERGGISQFNGKIFTCYNIPAQTVRPMSNYQQVQIVNDTTWWLAQGSVFFITKGQINNFTTPGPDGVVSSMLAERGGIWIAKDSVVYHSNHNSWDTLKFKIGEDQKIPTARKIYRDKAGMVWVAGNQGLYKLDNKLLISPNLTGDTLSQPLWVNAITQDKTGALWLAVNKGVIKITGDRVQKYNKHNGLSDNTFFDMLTDNEGNVWMASDGQGIFRFSGTQFTVLDESMGLPSAQVMAIASNNRDSLFLGTYDAGIYIFKEGKAGALEFPSKPAPSVTALCYTNRGKLWIGTHDRGLWSYQDEIFRQYAYPERSNFPSNIITGLYEDTSHRLWVGFANGAMMFDNDNFKTIVAKNVPVLSFLAIGRDSILIATESGLMLYYAGIVSDFRTNTIADSANIQCFIIKDRKIWMGSSDKGLIAYDMETNSALVINKNKGLRSDFIYNITADEEGNIWVGTGFGIHKIKVSENGEFKVAFYGKAQGITGMESNLNSVIKLKDSSIWFGTTNGALHYQPHTALVSSVPNSIMLQSVKLTGEPVIDPKWYDSLDNWYNIPYNLRLPYKKNNISFTFQAVSLSGAQQLLYRYRMDGLETPWSDWSVVNSVSFSALPPGNYVFKVECRGNEEQNNAALAYPFEIIVPFQKTYWFRLATLFGCILAGIFIQFIFNSRKQRRQRLLEKLRVEEQSKIRLRTAEDFHDEIGNKLTRINVLTNVLKNKITLTPDTGRILEQIEDNTGQLYSGTRDILWSLKPSNDNLYEILQRIRDFGGEMFQDTEVDFNFTGLDEKWRKYRLPMDMSRNLIMIFKEALNNCLKYSQAKNVWIEASLKNRDVLHLVLRDNGLGFDTNEARKGNGINNMNIRAARLNGRLYIDSKPGKGTIMSLAFKITGAGMRG